MAVKAVIVKKMITTDSNHWGKNTRFFSLNLIIVK